MMNTPLGKPLKLSIAASALFCALATGSSPVSAAPGDNRVVFGPSWVNRAEFNTTVRGTINRFGGNRAENFGAFELLAENGETLRVLVNGDARFVTGLSNFRNNTRVEVEGLRDGDALLARDVRFQENGRYISILRGIVQSTPTNNRFNLTLDTSMVNNGSTTTTSTRTITVVDRNANTRLFRNLRRGDQVEVRGLWQQGNGRWQANSFFEAQSVTNTGISSGIPGNDDYLSGRLATVRGRATNNSDDEGFLLDLGNNQLLKVRAAKDIRVRRNDTVEVSGRYDRVAQNFRAETVRVLTGSDVITGNNLNFPATVLTVRSATRLSVRGDNNRTYEVISNYNLNRNISQGDRVRITGVADTDGTIRADRVLLESDYNSNNTNNMGRVDFIGSITDTPFPILRDYYTVRSDDGRDYRVSYNGNDNLRKGDRVRVRGNFDNNNNNTVIADSIDRY